MFPGHILGSIMADLQLIEMPVGRGLLLNSLDQ